jgi:hypothetical protein
MEKKKNKESMESSLPSSLHAAKERNAQLVEVNYFNSLFVHFQKAICTIIKIFSSF